MSEAQDVTEPTPVQPVLGSRQRMSDRNLILAAVFVAIAFIVGSVFVQNLWKQHRTDQLQKSFNEQPVATATAASETVQPEVAPWVSVDKPTSLVIRRGADEVLRADRIGEMAAVDTIVSQGYDPVWLNNVGTGVGTDMRTAWIVGHNIVGATDDPFGRLGNVRPGDVIEVSNSGGTVRAVVNLGVGDQPSDGVWTVSKSVNDGYIVFTDGLGIVKLVSCTDDGTGNIVVTATVIK